MSRINLLNQKFGKLLVVKQEKTTNNVTYWMCQCDCGKTTVVPTGSLRSGNSKTCGCSRDEKRAKLTDLKGKKFNRLTVLEFHRFEILKGGSRRNFWWCKCDCGKEKSINHYSIMSGKTKSCGCLQKEINIQKSTRPEAAFNKIYRHYVARAQTENRDFTITPDEFFSIVKRDCNYCGVEPKQVSKAWAEKSEPFLYNGIDRMDSNKGYTIGNCVPCCKHCNYAKGNMTVEEFRGWLKKAYEYFVKI